MQGSTMTMTSTNETLVVNQFPQPVRPANSYDDFESIPSTSTAYPRNPHSSSKPLSQVPQVEVVVGYPQQSIDHLHVVPPTAAKEEEREKKVALVDKLVNRVLERYEKLEVNLEELAEERNREVKSSQSISNSRGLEQPVEGGPQEIKLERFKIRTVVAGEVVTEDENKK